MASQLLRLLEVMDRLRSPGGCPWDAEQSHQTLIKYLLEESYEFVDAVDEEDREAMREELGDILLQVYFHSRIAQEHPTDPFSIEDVAEGIADKLIRRHPHVFGDVEVSGSDEVLANWEQLKAAEKNRKSATDGVALSQPALPLITKLIYRAEKNGIKLDLPTADLNNVVSGEVAIGDALVAAVVAAIQQGIEPEDLLRSRAREIAAEIKRIESL
ncbi:MAG: MazG family protein [Actinomycetales bacterium]|nr:MazG family protein [Actinomycetales bacterium]